MPNDSFEALLDELAADVGERQLSPESKSDFRRFASILTVETEEVYRTYLRRLPGALELWPEASGSIFPIVQIYLDAAHEFLRNDGRLPQIKALLGSMIEYGVARVEFNGVNVVRGGRNDELLGCLQSSKHFSGIFDDWMEGVCQEPQTNSAVVLLEFASHEFVQLAPFAMQMNPSLASVWARLVVNETVEKLVGTVRRAERIGAVPNRYTAKFRPMLNLARGGI